MQRFNIKIYSDNVCPWCFVGKRNLEAAIAQRPDAIFNVQWKPFFLDPNSPENGEPVMPHLLQKYGEVRGRRMMDALAQAGAAAGIRFTDKRRIHNTMQSHKLVRLAGEQSVQRQNDVIESIFRAYFEDGKNIADVELLCAIADQAGVAGAREELASTAHDAVVLEEYKDAIRRLRISGVPHFIVEAEGNREKIELGGAQPVDEFSAALDALAPRPN